MNSVERMKKMQQEFQQPKDASENEAETVEKTTTTRTEQAPPTKVVEETTTETKQSER